MILYGAHSARPARGGCPPDLSLSNWIARDVGVCLELNGLAVECDRFTQYELYRRASAHPAIQRWLAVALPQWEQTSAELQRQLGYTAAELWRALFSERVLLAIWPPTVGQQEGSALLFIQTTDKNDKEVLLRLAERLVDIFRADGRLKDTRQLAVAGEMLDVYVLSTDEQELFLCVEDGVALLSNREELLAATVNNSDKPENTLAAQPAYQAAIGRLAPGTSIRAFLNPRVWDAHLRAGRDADAGASKQVIPGLDRGVEDLVEQTWAALDYVALGVQIGPRITVEEFVAWNSAKLPVAVSELTASTSGPNDFLEKVPANALAVAAGRLDLNGVLSLALPAANQSRLPPELVALRTLARSLGPSAGCFLAAPAADGPFASAGAVASSLDFVCGVQTRSTSSGADPVVSPALRTLVSLAVWAENARAGERVAKVEAVEWQGAELISMTGVGPLRNGIAATFAAAQGYAWAGSSPAAVANALQVAQENSLAHSPAFKVLLNPNFGQPSHIVYLRLAGLRDLLESAPELLDHWAEEKALSPETAEQSRQELLALLDLADDLLVAARVDENGAALSLSISAQSR